MTDKFESEFISVLQVEIEIKRVKFNKKNKASYKTLGTEILKLKSILEIPEEGSIQLNILNSSKKLRGTLLIGDSTLKPVFSFLDYKINLDINIVPVVAIDYSLSNLSFANKRHLIHTLKTDEDNDYISVLRHIMKVYGDLTSFMMGFGMGGKTYPKQHLASDIFALSGNMFNPVFNKEELVEKYGEVFSKISVSTPINYSPVCEIVADYARYEKENYEARNFYSLIYITPGLIDDYEKTLSTIKEMIGLPMCVTVVKLYNDQLNDTNDTLSLAEDLKTSSELSDLYRYIDYQKFKEGKALREFEVELIRQVPLNVQRYFAANNTFAFDLEESDYANRMCIRQK
uniref:Copine C-terminal domain-containing protein n=1 Tax=Euplotes harpa TaxID=151035 RepID=A0A7S3N8N0_9SPIT|mmetsp:Transcript_18668/g.21453  ORF Transcript_18668/g.21453 Transcript_18668/m.21453 type:complete len:344 (+) Transcript_18668:794-1825(+)